MFSETEKLAIQHITDIDWPNGPPDFYVKGSSYAVTQSQLRELEIASGLDIVNSTNIISQLPLYQLHGEPFHYWAMILLIFPLVTVFGNVLVVLSVFRDQSLHTATNYFIVSLAIADISLAIVVMPVASWVEVSRCRSRCFASQSMLIIWKKNFNSTFITSWFNSLTRQLLIYEALRHVLV